MSNADYSSYSLVLSLHAFRGDGATFGLHLAGLGRSGPQGLDEAGLPEAAFVPTASGEHIPVESAGYTVGGGRTVFDADGHN